MDNSPPQSLNMDRLRLGGAALAGVLITAVFIAAAFFIIRASETKSLDDLRNQALKQSAQNAQTVQSVSLGLQGFIHAVGKFNGDQFRAFAEEAIARHEFIREAAYYKRVKGSEREAFRAEAEDLGLAFGIVDGLRFKGRRPKPRPAGQRDQYYPLIHKDLRSEDRTIFGLDLLSLPGRTQALEQAIESAAPVLIGPETNIDGELVAQVIVAVYDTDRVPTQIADRMKHAKGIASVSVAIVPLLGDSLVEQSAPGRAKTVKRARGPKAITALDDLLQKAERVDKLQTKSSVAHTNAWFSLAALDPEAEHDPGKTELSADFEGWSGGTQRQLIVSAQRDALAESSIAFVRSTFELPVTSRHMRVDLVRPLYLSTIDAWIIWVALANALVVAAMLIRVTYGKIVIRRINAGLEETVAQRTESLRQAMQEIREIQQNLEVGVFVLDDQGRALGNYSPICHELFAVENLTGMQAEEFLFVGDPSEDEALARHQSSMQVVYGSGELQWEMVRPCFLDVVHVPRSAAEGEGDGSTQVFKLEYAPLYDRDELVERVLVVATDITEMLAMQASAAEANRAAALKIAIVRELLAADAGQLQSMLGSAEAQLDRSETALAHFVESGDMEQIDQIFRDLHTLKGNSRGCGLDELSGRVHHAESSLYELRNGAAELEDNAKDREKLAHDVTEELSQLRQLYAQYLDAANTFVTPTATVPAESRGASGLLLADLEQLAKLEAIDNAARSQFRDLAALERSRSGNACFGLVELFRSHSPTCHALAESLDRPLADLAVRGQGELYLAQEVRSTIDTALLHLTRNAVDHGIENRAHRQASDKADEATIHLGWRVTDEALEIDIGDDGHGLDLEAIARKAKDLGLLGEVEAKDGERLTDLIFEPGFSSREEVTEISGRGVGLDAVRHALRQVEGEISVHSVPGASTTFTLRLPNSILAFVSDGSGVRRYETPTQNAAKAGVVPAAAA